jgi:hypothetical protein
MGKVLHRYGARWLRPFEYELQEFPNGRFDDQLDAASYCHEMAVKFNPNSWREVGVVQRDIRRRQTLDDVVARGESLASMMGASGRRIPR